MAHRGRLNVLANIMNKNVREIFAAFDDADPERYLGSGDVKYHLGYSTDRATASGRKVHLSLAFNPSHLEFVNPVVEGRVRAKQDRRGEAPPRVMPLLIHGDAAFMGQGVVAETLNLAGLEGYTTGGTIHLVALKVDPANPELHNVLAQTCLSAKKYTCALDEFSWILKRNPDSAAVHILMGEALDGLGRTPEAIAEFLLAAKADPHATNVNFGLGYLYWKTHQYDDAKREFEAELSLDPNHAEALAYLGDVEWKRNHLDQAVSLLKRATEAKSDLRIAQLDLGAVLTQQRHYKEALAALKRAVELDPTQPDAHYRLGRLYQAMGKKEEGQAEFARVQQLQQKTDSDLVRKMSDQPPPLPK